MEDLIAQFTLLSDEALGKNSFDPIAIEDLMKLFEVEAYKSWAAMELSCLEEAQNSVEDSAMDSAIEEFQGEMTRTSSAELSDLVHIGAATSSAVASMRSALKGQSSSSAQKVHPSS